jgi:cell division protein FtsI (penicillin-binding protein 3)
VSQRLPNRRIRILAVCFLAVFGLTLARAVWLQVVRGPAYDAMATRQHRETIILPASRGTILDRTGEPLAIGEQATTVYVDPAMVRSPQKIAVAAAKTLGLDANAIYKTLQDRKKRFVYLQRQADPVKAGELQKLGLPGIGFYGEEKRSYPQGRVGAQVIGFAGTDNVGLDGLERSLEEKLQGRAGAEIVIKDPLGRAIDVVRSRAERPGKAVTLTLDHQIQAATEDILTAAVTRFRAHGGTAIVMDLARDGAILAMANAPTINANRFGTAPPDLRRNRAVTDVYEPGSTFKIVTIAAALEEGIVTPTSSFTLAPTIQVADRVIREAHRLGTERMTVRDILAKSSNVGTVTVAQELGSTTLASWISKFGFGRKTGIDFPGEVPGMALSLDDWSGSTIGTVPLGQGIAVTPMQMVSAYAAIGNGGVMPEPHLVDKIGGRKMGHGRDRRVVSEHTANRMMGMFRDVVLDGTGTEAAIPGYTVAGKTGTALKAENGVYVRKYVASFVGLVPAKRPRLAILVMVDEPHGSIFGGEVAAPAFRDIAAFSLQYLEIPPDEPESLPGAQTVALGRTDPQ